MTTRERVQTGSLAGERRHVTALYYDIVGSTTLLNQLDPEEFGAMQRSLHNGAAALISDYNGYLERVHGDGGCAYFGFPESREDAAECAVASAIEIVEWCEKLARQSESSLKVRVGITTGVVVIADASKTNLPGATEIIGVAPALAARIQSEAAPNSVAVAEATYRLTMGAFEFEEIGPRHLKGFGEPVLLWRPLTRRQQFDRFTAYRRVSAPLIGREDELELCGRRWVRAANGNGQFILLHGDPGIGKSRLIAEFRRDLAAKGVRTLVFQCQPRGNSEPLHPFLEPLRKAIADATGNADPDRDAVTRYLRSHGSELGALNAEIITFLVAGETEGGAGQAWQVDLSNEEIRARVVEAMLSLLTSPSVLGPLLLIIEDVHWADTLTKALVAKLSRWIETRPILAAVTSREAIAPDGFGDPNVLAVALSGLTAQATAELLSTIWEDYSPPDELVAFIYEKSDGVPLFAEQLALWIRERAKAGLPDRAGLEALLRADSILDLRDLLAARLASLGPLRRVAQIASVLGRQFRRKLLACVLELGPLAIPLDEAIEGLVQAGIVRRKSGGMEIRFRHVLIQEAAYESLLKSERQEIHTSVVNLIQSGVVPPLSDETMAWHFGQAGQPVQAARHAIQAAEACDVRSAMQEAENLLDFAEKQLAQAGRNAESNEQLLRLLTVRGPVVAALFGRGSKQARAIYERGVSLCATVKDRDRAEWFPLYWGWWFTAPDYQTQRARSDILVQDLEGSADPEVRLQSLHCAWATNIDAGLHSHCLKCVEQGLVLYDEDRACFNRGRYGGHDAKVCGLGERAFSLWFVGDDNGASESIIAAKRWAEHINHPNSMLHALEFEIELKRYRNDHPGVIAVSERIGELGRATPGVLAKAALFRAWAQGMSGDAAAGVVAFETELTRWREIATYEGAPVFEGMRSELLERAGRNDEALSILDSIIAASTSSGQVFWLAELLRQRGVLRHTLGESQEAVMADLRRALEVSTEQRAAPLASRVRLDLDRLRL
ncbi:MULTISPECIES: adenylate/guanylate cyclase domain-containing protein [unclassified Mesorhizobium]|uniref:ATP-binding protein n=1 Tax=unclassified Mesorhizobium TaxID=325217 RepID=UPI0003FCA6AF|nr:adenylate/guanylate cyclase domain-containing protein [Mesorhizobium sp. LSHC420B00]